jgi:hypothetical protein
MEISVGSLGVNAGMSKFSGVDRDTLIANSVVASRYTPGAGNVIRGSPRRRRMTSIASS